MTQTDTELVNAVRSGRREAYDELVRRHVSRIRAGCWSRVGRRGPVDDLVQETFLRGFRAIESLADPEKFGRWLYGIAVRVCLDWLKSKERSQVSFGSLSAEKNPEAFLGGRPRLDLEEDEQNRRILDGVEALPEIHREVIILYYYKKRSYKEMSAMLEISPAGINARLGKARAMLRESLARVIEP